MFPNPRWRKVLRDLWSNKLRTILVVISIAIGVAAIGTVAGTYAIITRDLPASYAKVNPASASITTAPFDDSLVRVINNLENVKEVEGRYSLKLRLMVGPDEWRDLQVVVISDFRNIRINKIWPFKGGWPPQDRSILIERASLLMTRANVGDTVLVETPDGKQRELRIDGLVHDLNKPAGTFTNQVNGYINFNTLEWLGYSKSYNELLFTVDGNSLDLGYIRTVAIEVGEKIEKGGRPVYWTMIPDPGKHWFESYLTPMAFILGVMGVIILLLSSFLVINTITALLAQQARQMGIMKAIGARTSQLVVMYLVSVLVIGSLALAVAVPIGSWGTKFTVNLLSSFINFDIRNFETPVEIVRLQIALSLLIPVLAAFFPILSSTRITVREAISDYGLSKVNFGTSFFDRLIANLRGLSRPLMLSIRNTFRRKGRLFLTLATLTLGSAIFIAVLSVYTSLLNTLDSALKYYAFDVGVFFSHPYRIDQIEQEVNRVPGVATAETWGISNVRIVREDGSESNNITLVAPPTDTKLINPTLIQGRWLVPEDDNAIVINTDVFREQPNLKVGDEVTFKIDGLKSTWHVVGIVRSVMIGPWAYTNNLYLSQVLGKAGMAGAVYIALDKHDPRTQFEMAKILENHFESVGLRVSSVGKVAELRSSAIMQYQVVVVFLLVMAALITIVGGLGLMGTMSLNVIERTREIGVMRAIGAANGAITRIVISEGIMISLISWSFGTLLAVPLSNILTDAVGKGFLKAPLNASFSTFGAILWLGVVILLAVLASLLPARSATRLTVRDVLSYE